MSLITLNNDLEQHYLQHEEDSKALLVEEPQGWKDSDKSLKRSSDTNEFISKNAKNVKFYGKGRDYILTVDRIYGPKAKIRYTIVKQNPHDSYDFYKDVYFLDLKEYKDKDGIVSIKIDEGGLAKLLKAKQSEKVEIERTTSLEGESISELTTKKLRLDGRKILLNSILEADDSPFITAHSSHVGLGGKTITRIIPFPLKVITKSHDEIGTPTEPYIIDKGEDNNSTGAHCFYLLNQNKKDVELLIDISFWIRPVSISNPYDNEKIQLVLTILKDGVDFNLKERQILIDVPNPASIKNPTKLTYNNKINLTLEVDESISLEFLTEVKLGNTFNSGIWYWLFYECSGGVKFIEGSERPGTQTKVVLAHELIDRQLEIITGQKGLLYSDYLGRKDIGYEVDGLASRIAVSSGWWVRQFESIEDKKFTNSLKDGISSFNAMWCLSAMVEKFGFKERYRVEDLSFFYNPNITVTLPYVVEDYETSYAKDFMYSSYLFGYEKGGSNYEEATGIGEYNGQIESVNELDTFEKKLSVLSKIRGDASAAEFARRKSKFTHPQEDTRYDNDLIAFDTKKGDTDVLLERKWADDFKESPTGIYSPETATNLRISPGRMRERRKFFLTGSLWHYPDSYIRYTNSNCNEKLNTKLIDGSEIIENGDVKVKDLGRAKFKPYWATFTHEVDYHLSKKLRSKTIINGKEIYNFYGLVEFRISENTFKYGYLFEVKESGKGKFKVLLANK